MENYFSKMNTIVFVVLTSVFGYTKSVNTVNVQKMINLAFQVHAGKNDANRPRMRAEPVKTMPNLINVDYDHAVKRINFRADNRDLKFTDFILEAAMILKTYENDVLKEVFAILDDELGKSVYNGCRSHELIKVKGYLSDQLGVLKDTPAETLRDHLDNMIKILKKEDYGDLADTVDLVNSFYVGENEKFIKVLLALMFKRISPGVNLDDVIRRALRYLFFEHYCNLSDKIRRELILTIEHYWKQFANLRVNNKIDHNENRVTFVTPFQNVHRMRKFNKKRRFKTVSEGRPAITKNDNAESDKYSFEHYTKHNAKNHKVFLSSEEAQDYLDKKQTLPEKQGKISFRAATNNVFSKNAIEDTSDYDDMKTNKNQVINDNVADNSIYEAGMPPIKVLRQPDLEKLENIKALAEDINGMITSEEKPTSKAFWFGRGVTENPDEPSESLPNITINIRRYNNKTGNLPNMGIDKGIYGMASKKKIERQGDEKEASDWQSLLWNLPLEFIKGDISIVPQVSQTTTEDNQKDEDFLVSMNVKYNE